MIVEFEIDSDVLSHALQQVPGMSVVVDQLDASDTVPLRNLFWASGGEFEAFETALAADPTISTYERLTETDGGRLYRVQYSDEVPEVEAYRASVELDGVVLHAENDGSGWLVRMRFPDREAIAAFCERCWTAGFDLRIRAVYDQREGTPEKWFGLTDAQHETLLTALRSGYFSIPRGASLEDVADELGVSSQAASERLRRGMKTLVRGTLADADDAVGVRQGAESAGTEH
jgi:predicted DNA binding protein